jgi:hypothetical protein
MGGNLIDAELREFLERGLVCVIGTRDAELRPDWAHGVGVRFAKSRCVVFIEQSTAARSLTNLRDNGMIAVTICEPATHRTIQLKGCNTKLRELTQAEQRLAQRMANSARHAVIEVGIAPRVAAGWNYSNLVAAEFELTGVFDATPGPNAGAEVA